MDTAAEMPNPRGRVLGTGVSLNVKLACKNWYSNSRTVSDDHAHELWMIARSVTRPFGSSIMAAVEKRLREELAWQWHSRGRQRARANWNA
jgi:hypothetical protein